MLETARSKKIQNYIKTHPQQKDANQMYISYGGQIHRRDLYWIPIEGYLIHNIRNGRFRAELLAKEEQLKRKLEPTKKEDAVIIRELLLNQNRNETAVLTADIKKNGQLDPGIITFDGAVINANRRMAIMHTLYLETRDDKYKYLLVSILPPGIDESDLWKIEAGLQFGRDFRLEYSGVNELLKLREGENQGLDDKEISLALLGRFSEKQVREKLDTLNLIDSYLEFIGKPKEYHRIMEEQALEKFNSLQKSVIAPLKNKHGKKKSEIAELTAIAFALINKADVTHWDIRELKNISLNQVADKELRSGLPGGIPASNTKINVAKLQEAYTSAREVVENKKDEDKPQRLLKRAKSALDGINEKSPKLKEKDVATLIMQIGKRVEVLSKAAKIK